MELKRFFVEGHEEVQDSGLRIISCFFLYNMSRSIHSNISSADHEYVHEKTNYTSKQRRKELTGIVYLTS